MNLSKEIASMYDDAVRIRQDLHRIPEIGFQLHDTQAYVLNELRQCAPDRLETPAVCGVKAVFFARDAQKTIALRADMDGIHNQEANDVPYRSQRPGCMHGCGHDGHMTILLLLAADIPVFAGVGGGLTKGQRVVNLAMFAEMQGATGVVLNAPTANTVVQHVAETIDIPVVVTVARADTDFDARLQSGTNIFNVSAAAETPAIVRSIRERYPDVPIIATGGPTDESILETIQAGANAITWTPPTNGEIFRDIMAAYRDNKPHP